MPSGPKSRSWKTSAIGLPGDLLDHHAEQHVVRVRVLPPLARGELGRLALLERRSAPRGSTPSAGRRTAASGTRPTWCTARCPRSSRPAAGSSRCRRWASRGRSCRSGRSRSSLPSSTSWRMTVAVIVLVRLPTRVWSVGVGVPSRPSPVVPDVPTQLPFGELTSAMTPGKPAVARVSSRTCWNEAVVASSNPARWRSGRCRGSTPSWFPASSSTWCRRRRVCSTRRRAQRQDGDDDSAGEARRPHRARTARCGVSGRVMVRSFAWGSGSGSGRRTRARAGGEPTITRPPAVRSRVRPRRCGRSDACAHPIDAPYARPAGLIKWHLIEPSSGR